MKTCPKCSKTFPDKYQFCLTDGTDLVESDGPPADPAAEPARNPLVYVLAAAGLLVIILMVVGAAVWLNSAEPASNSITAVRPSNSRPSAGVKTAPPSSDSDYRIGRTGSLNTNLRLRAASNKDSDIVGVHYRGARVKILEVDSYDTPDGYSTWFRVQVIENGCDAEGQLGCGSEGGDAGWMNARHITME